MNLPHQLTAGERRILTLIRSSAQSDGFARVSRFVFPAVEALYPNYVKIEMPDSPNEPIIAHASLTDLGNKVVDAFELLLP